jgi:hypothetical protein
VLWKKIVMELIIDRGGSLQCAMIDHILFGLVVTSKITLFFPPFKSVRVCVWVG